MAASQGILPTSPDMSISGLLGQNSPGYEQQRTPEQGLLSQSALHEVEQRQGVLGQTVLRPVSVLEQSDDPLLPTAPAGFALETEQTGDLRLILIYTAHQLFLNDSR